MDDSSQQSATALIDARIKDLGDWRGGCFPQGWN